MKNLPIPELIAVAVVGAIYGSLTGISVMSKGLIILPWVFSPIFGAITIFTSHLGWEVKKIRCHYLVIPTVLGLSIFISGLPIWLYQIGKDYVAMTWLQEGWYKIWAVSANSVLFFLGAGLLELFIRLRGTADVLKKCD